MLYQRYNSQLSPSTFDCPQPPTFPIFQPAKMAVCRQGGPRQRKLEGHYWIERKWGVAAGAAPNSVPPLFGGARGGVCESSPFRSYIL